MGVAIARLVIAGAAGLRVLRCSAGATSEGDVWFGGSTASLQPWDRMTQDIQRVSILFIERVGARFEGRVQPLRILGRELVRQDQHRPARPFVPGSC